MAAQLTPSRVFDSAVVMAGALAALGLLAVTAARGWEAGWLPLLAVPVVAVVARFPIHLDQRLSWVSIGQESGVLVLLLCLLRPHEALLTWLLGAAVDQVLTVHRRYRPFNLGLLLLSGSASAATFDAVRGGAAGTSQELLAVLLACTVHFVVDLIVSEVSCALEADTPLPWRRLLGRGGGLALVAAIGVGGFGYLAALVIRELPVWSLALLAAPAAALVAASSARSREQETARRLQVLLEVADSAAEIHAMSDVDALLDDAVKRLVRAPASRWGGTPPGPHETGRPVTLGDEVRWLVTGRFKHQTGASLDDEAALSMLAAIATDLVDRITMTGRLREEAERDALTGLANRAVVVSAVQRMLQQPALGMERVVMFCDLDGFKAVNDRLGHHAGDALLREVAGALAAAVPSEGLVGRLGGDEFAVVLQCPAESVERIARDACSALSRTISHERRSASVSGSVGVAAAHEHDTSDGLLQAADDAMYEAKRAGGGRVVVRQPGHPVIRPRGPERFDARPPAPSALPGRPPEAHHPAAEDSRHGGGAPDDDRLPRARRSPSSSPDTSARGSDSTRPSSGR